MSVELYPEWCAVKIPDELVSRAECPHCGKKYSEVFVQSLVEKISGNYYEVAHIPPSITLTCDNPECIHCDDDFEITLQAVIIPS